MFSNKEYIYAVYKEKSFSKAAEKLYVTQPCLSAMVKKIEKRLGMPIFNRNVKPVQLTDCGKTYIKYAEQVMNIEQQFERYLDDVRGLKTGAVSIGANSVCSSFVLPEIVKKFSDMYPEIHIELHEGNVNYLNDELQNGSLDMILDNYSVDESMFEVRKFRSEHLVLAVPAPLCESRSGKALFANDVIAGRHLKAGCPQTLFSQFSALPFIILRKGNDTRDRFELLCQEGDFEPHVLLEVDQLATAYNIACSGIGAALVSDTLIKKMPPSPNLRYYKIESPITSRDLFFHFSKSRYVSLAMEKFMEEAGHFL